jgi:hypothetical protein
MAHSEQEAPEYTVVADLEVLSEVNFAKADSQCYQYYGPRI